MGMEFVKCFDQTMLFPKDVSEICNYSQAPGQPKACVVQLGKALMFLYVR